MCDQPSHELPALLERLSLSEEVRVRFAAQDIPDLESFVGLLAANPEGLATLLETSVETLQKSLAACLEEIRRHGARRADELSALLSTQVPEFPLGALAPGDRKTNDER